MLLSPTFLHLSQNCLCRNDGYLPDPKLSQPVHLPARLYQPMTESPRNFPCQILQFLVPNPAITHPYPTFPSDEASGEAADSAAVEATTPRPAPASSPCGAICFAQPIRSSSINASMVVTKV